MDGAGPGPCPVGPAEEYLEYLRVQRVSPNTVKSYARALALWWEYLAQFGLGWDGVMLEDFGGFLSWLRTGEGPQVVSIGGGPARFAESTIAVRLRAVLSCYPTTSSTAWTWAGSCIGSRTGRGGGYKPLLEHIARRKRPTPGGDPGAPVAAGGTADADAGADRADLRRLRELGSARHGSGGGQSGTGCCGRFLPGRGLGWARRSGCSTATGAPAAVTPRSSRSSRASIRTRYGSRAATGGCISPTRLDRLYGEYVWQLCELGADLATDDFDDCLHLRQP